MIRRHAGNEFWLIAQHDHALLAGELARHVGNHTFDKPSDHAILGIELHDCGWPIHDEHPTLSSRGLPLDVFESPRSVTLEVWQASVDRATARDAYGGLLVSLHVLALSITATAGSTDRMSLADAKSKFEVNRFQHKQIETQEELRRKLALPVDVPMRHGLVEGPDDPAELGLQFHFRLLQAMDQISLGLCCTTPPWNEVRPVLARPGAKAGAMTLSRQSDTELRIRPWPFDADRIEVSVPFRRVRGAQYASREELDFEYANAKVDILKLAVRS